MSLMEEALDMHMGYIGFSLGGNFFFGTMMKRSLLKLKTQRGYK